MAIMVMTTVDYDAKNYDELRTVKQYERRHVMQNRDQRLTADSKPSKNHPLNETKEHLN